jgi:hypothetical protein
LCAKNSEMLTTNYFYKLLEASIPTFSFKPFFSIKALKASFIFPSISLIFSKVLLSPIFLDPHYTFLNTKNHTRWFFCFNGGLDRPTLELFIQQLKLCVKAWNNHIITKVMTNFFYIRKR